MGGKRGEKVLVIGGISQFGKRDFPRLDYLFSRIFFFLEGRRKGTPWCGDGWAAEGCPSCLLCSEQQHRAGGFNDVIYGHFAATEVSIWLKEILNSFSNEWGTIGGLPHPG